MSVLNQDTANRSQSKHSDLVQVSMVALGTSMLWFGLLGFNGGSAFGANLRAIMAVWNSMIAAACGGITWCLLDYRIERKFSMVGFCSGTIAGLVAATPASGYIPPWASLVMGVLAGFVSNFSTKRELFGSMVIDDKCNASHAGQFVQSNSTFEWMTHSI
jgi:Amt family ammonium transporter